MPTTCKRNDEHRFESQCKSFPACWSKSALLPKQSKPRILQQVRREPNCNVSDYDNKS